MSANAPGRRTFIAGSIVLIVGGAMHLVAVAVIVFGEPSTEADARYRAAARAFDQSIGPFDADAWGGTQILSVSYALLLVYAGAANWYIVRPSVERRAMRTLCRMSAALCALMLAVAVWYQFPPPIFFSGLASMFFAISIGLQRAGSGGAANP